MKKLLSLLTLSLIAFLMNTGPAFASATLLHEFSGPQADGSGPLYGSLAFSSGTIYGTTQNGGQEWSGILYSVNSDGSNYTILHDFEYTNPESQPIVVGGKIYGMDRFGGTEYGGSIYSVNTDGTGFTTLHSFGVGSDGKDPRGSLVYKSGKLYGMTSRGGSIYSGVLFSINTDGTGYTILHSFSGGYPYGTPVISGGELYGMTQYGGNYGYGEVFKINIDGTGYGTIHSFAGLDGRYPYGDLVVSGNSLYGMTTRGGSMNIGTIFSMRTDGAGFKLLHDFEGGVNDGSYPYGSLLLSGNTLYGLSNWGGEQDKGTVFSIQTNGTNFTLLHEFAGGVDDGAIPYGSLILNGRDLLGTTFNGGDTDLGTVFSLRLP